MVKGGRSEPGDQEFRPRPSPTEAASGRSVWFTRCSNQEYGRIANDTPEAFTARDGWITIRPRFTPARGRTYTLTVDAHDINGNHASGQ